MPRVSFWKNRRVFVTGANGFLGSHLTGQLIARGVKPVVLIYEENPGSVFDLEGLAKQATVVRGDIRDLALIERALAAHRIDTIFHLAAQAIVDQAVDDPLETFEVNMQGTWNILEAAKNAKSVTRVIVASSDKAYGHNDELPYREHITPLRGIYPYEVSKTCADLIAQSYAKTFGVPVCITRMTNFYGPGDLKFNRIIPRTIARLHYDLPPIIRDTPDSLRDYLYVEDAAAAYLRLAEAMKPSLHGHAFNFSTNRPLSVGQVISIISRQLGKDIAPTIIHTAGFEIKSQYASHAKARRHLGWRPETTFRQGIAKTIPWYLRHLHGRRKPPAVL